MAAGTYSMTAAEWKDELVKAVRAHAEANYEREGWDLLVEAYDDEQIKEIIGRATSVNGAIARCREVVTLVESVRRDVVAASGEPQCWCGRAAQGKLTVDIMVTNPNTTTRDGQAAIYVCEPHVSEHSAGAYEAL